MDLNNGSPHIPVPNPNRKESRLHDSNSLNLPEARVPAQSEYESVFTVSKNGAEMVRDLLLPMVKIFTNSMD